MEYSRDELKAIFEPRSIIFYGASEKLYWMRGMRANLDLYDAADRAYAVNRTGTDVFGIPGYRSCAEIGKQIDAAYVLIASAGVPDALRDLANVGVKTVVILSSNFAEAGDEGDLLQKEIAAVAAERGMAIIGPNCLGFVNVGAGTLVSSLPGPGGKTPKLGRVAIVGQSGGLVAELVMIAGRFDVDLSFYGSTGNEADICISDIVDYLVDDTNTQVIAVCAEQIRKPERFLKAARRARAAGKPVVVLKLGASELTAKVAQAHTGSLVGDDRVFSAVCDSLDVIRVTSMDDLIQTAGLCDALGRLEKPGIAFVTISGGACTLIADAAARYGVSLPEFAEETHEKLRAILPSFAATLNPLDITGGSTSRPEIFREAINIIAADPNISRTCAEMDFPVLREPLPAAPLYKSIGEGLRDTPPSGIHLVGGIRDISPNVRAFADDAGIDRVFAGIESVMRGIGAVTRWSEGLSKPLPDPTDPVPFVGPRPTTERQVMDALASHGVSVVPGRVCATVEQALEEAERLSGPLALKLASADVQHKSDIGAVKLNVEGAAAVREAYDAIIEAARRHAPTAAVDGVIVSPMRKGGTELIVGIARDPEWGLVLAVGLGGVWVEALKDVALRLLPASADQIVEMLESLKGAAVLKGLRGSRPADLQALAGQIAKIGEVARAFGPDLVALEVNPLRVDGSDVEALDALAVWAS